MASLKTNGLSHRGWEELVVLRTMYCVIIPFCRALSGGSHEMKMDVIESELALRLKGGPSGTTDKEDRVMLITIEVTDSSIIRKLTILHCVGNTEFS